MVRVAPASSARWHTLTPEALCRELGSDLRNGLSKSEAARRLATHGPNELPEAPPTSPLTIFLAQFSSLIIWVLIGAAVVSGLLHEWIDAGAIIAIVVMNAVLGFVQEYRAERSLAALKKLSIATARAIRDGIVRSVPSRELVPGDLIQVEAGDHVPADARLLSVASLRTQEAALTGESTPVDKSAAVMDGNDLSIAERYNMLFMGTVVVGGKGRALVAATGLKTELGRIAAMLQAPEPEVTPLQRRLEQLGHVLLYLSLGIVTLVFVLGLLRGEPLVSMFLTAVSLAVAAIPEGLPAIVTITLALGVMRMVKRHALIRRLPAVETLGSTTVICTDKTGTLTKNEMTVTRLYLDGRVLEVTGEGYMPVGEIRELSRDPSHTTGDGQRATDNGLREVLTASVLCNGATLKQEQGTWVIIGDPTEGALLVAAAKLEFWKERLEGECPLIGEIPFDPDRKMMTVIRKTSMGLVAYVKGAPDVLLERCDRFMTAAGQVAPLQDTQRQGILNANRTFAHEALRVLGVACRVLQEDEATGYEAKTIERHLVFLGLAAMKDPLRPEATIAVKDCRDAGIRTVMITGDHKDTALAIARDLGLENGRDQALSGADLDRMGAGELEKHVDRVSVYARVSAEHKLRIVKAWKGRGAIVAMTGDGVNDAPALKAADIGVAMGMTGTDVAKEASDMVVTDDNFASVAAAVEEGRGIYANIRKAVQYLLSCNISEVLLMFLATLFAMPLPLLPVQILWINLVTDGFPALALAVDPKDPDVMRQSPRSPHEPFLTKPRLLVMFSQGAFLALISMAVFVYCFYWMDLDLDRARTLTFTIMVLAQLVHALNCRHERRSLFAIGVWTNKPLLWAIGGSVVLQAAIVLIPPLQPIFRVAPLDGPHWLLAGAVGILPLLAMEIWKGLRMTLDE